MLITLRRTVRTPKRAAGAGHRVQMSIPAAKWEIEFEAKLAQLEK